MLTHKFADIQKTYVLLKIAAKGKKWMHIQHIMLKIQMYEQNHAAGRSMLRYQKLNF
jgi:hypothetical protein